MSLYIYMHNENDRLMHLLKSWAQEKLWKGRCFDNVMAVLLQWEWISYLLPLQLYLHMGLREWVSNCAIHHYQSDQCGNARAFSQITSNFLHKQVEGYVRSNNLRLAFPCDHWDFVPFQGCHFGKYLSITFLRCLYWKGVPDSYKNLQTLALDDRVGRGNLRQLAETFLPRDSLKSEW